MPAAPGKAAAFGLPPIVWVMSAIVVAAIAAGAYVLVASRHDDLAPATQAKTKPRTIARRRHSRPARPKRGPLLQPPRRDLAPGVDGGSADADVPFFFRRQPVFYRTTYPVGTIIIDKQQHFLYLIQPNQVALRYGIGVGKPCAGVAGLRKVAGKVEWPEWQAPPEMVERKLARPAP